MFKDNGNTKYFECIAMYSILVHMGLKIIFIFEKFKF
jgi:hypothetical protein